MSGLIPYVEQYFPDPHDPRDPVRVSMMSGLAVSPRDSTIHATPRGCPMMSGLVPWSSGISPPTVPTPTSGAHQECFFPQRRACVEVIPGSSGRTGDGHRLIFRCWWRRSTNGGEGRQSDESGSWVCRCVRSSSSCTPALLLCSSSMTDRVFPTLWRRARPTCHYPLLGVSEDPPVLSGATTQPLPGQRCRSDDR